MLLGGVESGCPSALALETRAGGSAQGGRGSSGPMGPPADPGRRPCRGAVQVWCVTSAVTPPLLLSEVLCFQAGSVLSCAQLRCVPCRSSPSSPRWLPSSWPGVSRRRTQPTAGRPAWVRVPPVLCRRVPHMELLPSVCGGHVLRAPKVTLPSTPLFPCELWVTSRVHL